MNCANFNYKWTHENFSLLSSKTGTLQKVCISCSHTQHNLILCFILVFLFEVCFFLFYQKYFSLQDVNFDTSQLGGRKSLNQTRLKEHFYLILFLNVFWHFLDFFFRYSEVRKKKGVHTESSGHCKFHQVDRRCIRSLRNMSISHISEPVSRQKINLGRKPPATSASGKPVKCTFGCHSQFGISKFLLLSAALLYIREINHYRDESI